MSLLSLDMLPRGWQTENPAGKEEEEDEDLPLFQRLDRAETAIRTMAAALGRMAEAGKRVAPGYIQLGAPNPPFMMGGEFHRNMPTVWDYEAANRGVSTGGFFDTYKRYEVTGGILGDPEGVFERYRQNLPRGTDVSASVQIIQAREGLGDNYHVFFHGMVYQPPPGVPVSAELPYAYDQTFRPRIGYQNAANVAPRKEGAYLQKGLSETAVIIHHSRLSPPNCLFEPQDRRRVTALQVNFHHAESRQFHNATIILTPPSYEYVNMRVLYDQLRGHRWLEDKPQMLDFMERVVEVIDKLSPQYGLGAQ
jgi:hypothetical protein